MSRTKRSLVSVVGQSQVSTQAHVERNDIGYERSLNQAVCVNEAPGSSEIHTAPTEKQFATSHLRNVGFTAAEVCAVNTTEDPRVSPSFARPRRRLLDLNRPIQSCSIETSVWKSKFLRFSNPDFRESSSSLGRKTEHSHWSSSCISKQVL